MGVREWVEEKVDRAKQWYHSEREEPVEQRAVNRYIEREKHIEDKEDIDYVTGSRHGISEDLAEKWRKRSSDKYAKESVPAEKRYWNNVVGNVRSDWTSAKGRVRRATSPKAIKSYRSTYSRASKSALLGSGPGSQRSTQQFGNFLLTGSGTKSASSLGGGWGIMYGPRKGSGKSGRRSSRRKGRKGGGGGGGIGFL